MKINHLSRLFLLIVVVLSACAQPTGTPTAAPVATEAPTLQMYTQTPSQTAPQTAAPHWWNDTVFYEIFVRSFADSNGDGIGDFNGLTAKLDYLNDGDPNTTTDLGITGIWLMPIQPALSYHGYDVTDYFTVNPDYGTQADFENFMAQAHKRGIKVILDFVLNHSADENPWFVASKKNDPQYRDWYVWQDTKPKGLNGWYGDATTGFYYSAFQEHMPDLNYRNPAVTAKMEEAAKHWLVDEQVDGLRLDAAKYLLEDGASVESTDATHAWLKGFRDFYKGVKAEALTVGEVWSNTVVASTYAKGDQLDLVFDFDLAQAMILGTGLGNVNQINATLKSDLNQFKPNQFATFLTNHDQNRTMSALGDQPEKAKVAATLLLTGPGVPFIYYGEEIGMLGKKPDEDIRLPMQWSAEANGGFTTGTPWRMLNPDWATKNVAAESADPASLLSRYRTLINLRKSHAALRVGDTYLIDAGNKSVYAVLRVSEGETALVLINLGKTEVSDYGLNLAKSPLNGTYTTASLLGDGPFGNLVADGQGGFKSYKPLASLPAFGTYVIQLQP